MKKTEPKDETYKKLTKQRQMLVDMVLAKLEAGTQQWTAGWLTSRPPQSAVTGKPYRGMNALFLMWRIGNAIRIIVGLRLSR